MKILFISNLYPPNVYGGYERLCFDVASALHGNGHDITVLTSSYGEKKDQDIDHDVRRELFLFASEGNIYKEYREDNDIRLEHETGNLKKIDAVLDEVKPDIVFVWNLYFLNQGLIQALDNCGIPTTYLLTDNWMIALLNPSFIGSYFSNNVLPNSKNENRFRYYFLKLARSVRRLLSKNKFNMRGRAIFPSRYMSGLYKDAGFYFEGGESICYHGVRFLHSDAVKRVHRRLFRNEKEVRLLFAGRVVDIKGVHIAIEAVKEILEKNPGKSIKLTIVGDTQDQEYYQQLKTLIDRLGINDSIIFEPSVKEDRLFELFQEHDIYLFPSLYEPFSLTLIHALESGIPTVASNVGGNIEIVHDRKTGLLFRSNDARDLAEKIMRLIVDDTLRSDISQSAVSYAGAFTFENMVSRIEKDLEGSVR